MLIKYEWLQNELRRLGDDTDRKYAELGTTREQYLRSQAHHEAGHLVIAIALGFRMVHSGKIRLQGSFGGSCDLKMYCSMPDFCEIVLNAGYYAEKCFDPNRKPIGHKGNPALFVKDDFERALEYCCADDTHHEKLKKLTHMAVERRWSVVADFAAELLDKGIIEGDDAARFVRERLQLLRWPILPSLDGIQEGDAVSPWLALAALGPLAL